VGTLERVAPRLARAHAARRRELAEQRAARRQARDDVVRLERLVAHRELETADPQLRTRRRTSLPTLRRNLRYLEERHAKLNAARDALDRARARLAELDA
jgi:hypothetical protein